MDERTKQPWSSKLLQMRTRFRQSAADALHVPDAEAPPNQTVESDPARDDVATSLLPGQFDLVEHLSFDERELVTASWAAERSTVGRVAVAVEPASCQRFCLINARQRC